MVHPYNPLDKENLGESIASAILKQAPVSLPPPATFNGPGVYIIYYVGDFPPYELVKKENEDGKFDWPIYIGKAIPKGGRRGQVRLSDKVGPVMYNRLQQHAESIRQASNLEIEQFSCRYLVVDDIFIPLGESLLIQRFRPIWNMYMDGFGNHNPGSGRYKQKRSPWDTVHPGRSWALRCAENPKSETEILADVNKAIEDHLLQLESQKNNPPPSPLPPPSNHRSRRVK